MLATFCLAFQHQQHRKQPPRCAWCSSRQSTLSTTNAAHTQIRCGSGWTDQITYQRTHSRILTIFFQMGVSPPEWIEERAYRCRGQRESSDSKARARLALRTLTVHTFPFFFLY